MHIRLLSSSTVTPPMIASQQRPLYTVAEMFLKVPRVQPCDWTRGLTRHVVATNNMSLSTVPLSPSSNVDPFTTPKTRTRPTSKNSGHCLECHNGSHSENRDEATLSKPFRKSSRQNMVRNLNFYDKYIWKHRKRHSYIIALRALLLPSLWAISLSSSLTPG